MERGNQGLLTRLVQPAVPFSCIVLVVLEAQALAKIDQVLSGQLAEFAEDMADLVLGDRQVRKRSRKQGDKQIQHGTYGEGGPLYARGSKLLDQFQKGLPRRFLQRTELVVPEGIAELGRLILEAFRVSADDLRRNQKPAGRFE